MSFIRSTSNPERCYVFDDIGGGTCFFTGADMWLLPCADFRTLCKNWEAMRSDYVVGQLSIKEDLDTFQWQLRFNGQLIGSLWQVTWAYIARSVTESKPRLDPNAAKVVYGRMR